MAGRSRVRATRGERQPSPPTNAVVASAAHYRGNKAPKQYGTDKPWQERCYGHYAINGVARYAARYYGNALGKCTLGIAEPTDKGWVAALNTPENSYLDEITGGGTSESQLLDSMGVHMTIAGECFLVGRAEERPAGIELFSTEGPTKIWEVISPLEMHVIGEKWMIRYEGYPDIVLGEDDDVIRIWRPNPRRRLLADSPFKALLLDLDEIEQLTLHTFSQIRSRLINAGILFISENMRLPTRPAKEGQAQEISGATAFMMTMAELMEAAITDQGSPAANIPIVVQVPDDTIDKVKLLEFWSQLDQQTMPMKSAAIHRFAMGMDLPNEMVEGMSANPGTGGGRSTGVSHWGAWQIEESAIKVHIEPMLELICNAITVDFLRIVVPGTRRKVIASTEGLRLRPDRSREAFELYDRGAINLDALIRENGFADGDKMDDTDRKLWLLTKIAGGSATPDQVGAALKALGVILEATSPPSPAPSGDPEPATRESRPAPSLDDHPDRPKTPEPATAALVAACNAMALTALQRVGNRLIQAGVRPPGVATQEVHCFAEMSSDDVTRALDKAFPMASEILDGLADPADIMPSLKAYVASRIVTKQPHTKAAMLDWLSLKAA